MRILSISGSLRAGASNTALLAAAPFVAPPGVEIVAYEAVDALPHFNPDLDTPGVTLPATAADLRARIGQADGILLSTPEYAHGIPGAFKNVLDWLVGSVEFPGKPVAVLSASPWSVHAPAQLREVLTTMNAHLVDGACVTIPLLGRRHDAMTIANDPALSVPLRGAIEALVRAIWEQRAGQAT